MEEQIFTVAREVKARGGVFVPVFQRLHGARMADAYSRAGVSVETLDLERVNPSGLWHALRLIRKHRIKVIHWHFYNPLNPYMWLLSVLAPSVRHMRTDHSSRPWETAFRVGVKHAMLKRVLYRRYHKVVCVSSFVRECCERDGVWTDLVECHHFVNVDRFRPDVATRERVRDAYGVNGAFVALIVAQLIPEKGVDLAIRALSNVPADVQLWVAGDGAYARQLRELCDELGVSTRVRFLGTQEDVAPLMQAADCLLTPSMWAEAAGLVNLEAMAAELPVVASAVGGIPEYVEDGTSGLLFPRGSVTELAACIRRLHSDRTFARRLALAARQRVVAKYSKESRLEDFLDLYRISNGA